MVNLHRVIPHRVILALPLLLPSLALAASAQEATVTFYSSRGKPLTTDLRYFSGCVFDSDQVAVCLPRDRLVTLHLPAGPHLFSARFSGEHPGKHSRLPITLHANESYFIRVEAEYYNLFLGGALRGRLDIATCDVAQSETKKHQPADATNIKGEFQTRIVSTPSMPTCPASVPETPGQVPASKP